MYLQDKNVSYLDESLRKADAELPVSTKVDSALDAGELPEEKKVLMDEVEHINIDGQEQPGGIYVHRPGTGVPKTWESRKGRARSPDTQIYQEVDKSKEIPAPKGSGQGGLFNLGSFFGRTQKGSLNPSLSTTSGSQSVTDLDPKLPKTPHPNLKMQQSLSREKKKEAVQPGTSLTSTLSRYFPRKRAINITFGSCFH